MTTVGPQPVSEREAEVLGFLAEHLTNAEIGRLLHISVRTVESHVSSLLRKLDARDRQALADVATRHLHAGEGSSRGFRGLPTTWTSFVGRATELDEVIEAVGDHRLVTLVGPGGIGKTRLAVEAAGRVGPALLDGGAFVDLVPVRADGLVAAVASAIDACERPGETLGAVVHEQLGGGPALLVLDNCEHLLDAAATWVEGALAACPDLTVLATSRERLGVGGERVLAVPPLGDEAAALFTERTDDGRDLDEATVAEICDRLDGMPLAIELAAARLPALGPDGLLAALDHRLRLGRAGDGSPEARHRSLRAVIEWSHDLLDDEERRLLRRSSVFAGSFDLASLAAVATGGDLALAGDLVGRLAEKSLLVREQSGATSRWHLLATVHDYAREQLAASGEEDGIEVAHLRWAVDAAEAIEAVVDAGDTWFGEFDPIADDLRSTLTRPVADRLPVETFVLRRAFGHLTFARGLLGESRVHYLAAADTAPDPGAAINALRCAAGIAHIDQRYADLVDALERSAAVAEAAGDRVAAARSLADLARVYGRFPAGFEERPAPEMGRAALERARALDPGDDPGLSAALLLAAAWSGRPRPTEPDPVLAAEALTAAEALDDPMLISEALDCIASAAQHAGRFKESARLSRQRLDLLERLPRFDPLVGMEGLDVLHMVVDTSVGVGDVRAALEAGRMTLNERVVAVLPYVAASRVVVPLALLGEFDELLVHGRRMREDWERVGRPRVAWLSGSIFLVAMTYGLRGDDEAHREWFDTGVEWWAHDPPIAPQAFASRRLALHRGRPDLAGPAGPVDLHLSGDMVDYASAVEVELAVVTGAPDAAHRIDGVQLANPDHEYAAAVLARASFRLHGDAGELEGAVALFDSLGARFELACTLVLVPSRRAEGEAMLTALGCTMPAEW